MSTSFNLSTKFYLEPLNLEFGNEYNLNVIKEITATSSFLSMVRNVRKCQDDESFDECVTTKYIDNLIKKCNCLPLNLRLTEKVFLVGILRNFSLVLY